MAERYTGVIDRFEDDGAVILLESDGEVVDEHVVHRRDLPADASNEDAVVDVELDDGEIVALSYDPVATRRRKQRAEERFDRFAERPPSRDDEDR